MKRFALWGMTALFALTGCARLENENILDNEPKFPVKFTINMSKEVLPFTQTKAAPPLDVREPVMETRADGSELYDRIDYLVYLPDEGNQLLKQVTYTTEDLDFGMVYDSLPAGNYALCFIAHSSDDMTIDGYTARFGELSDTFHHYKTLSVSPGNEITEDITLQRVVGKVEFQATDQVPDDGKNFLMTVTTPASTLDLTTGYGLTDDSPLTYDHTFTAEERGTSGTTHGFLTFITNPGSMLSARLISYDQAGEILRERLVEEISPIANRIIRYKGTLYTPQNSDEVFNILIWNNGLWEDVDERPLPDE